MPTRRRARATKQIPEESEGQNEKIQRSGPVRRRARQVEDEVDVLAARVDEMELIMVRFQRMNPQTFDGDESSSDVKSWLQHITGLFDRVRYDDERRLSLATFQLRKNAERWAFKIATLLATRAWLRPVSRGNRNFTVDCDRLRQSGPRLETGFLRHPALEGLTRSARTDSPREDGPETIFRRRDAAATATAAAFEERKGGGTWCLGLGLMLSVI
ncbi:hypothetical protein F511_22670 [Dorcoceras hygrometricum]|uniref:Uncharacterized protein n=1 Tax=Dorcoceras hygrometricum TaxID=472368 RepID=A0A2Z7CQH9_9LAMI|nr:hypothetical protein F511_22670 [Dorcoceras hygrometricum]